MSPSSRSKYQSSWAVRARVIVSISEKRRPCSRDGEGTSSRRWGSGRGSPHRKQNRTRYSPDHSWLVPLPTKHRRPTVRLPGGRPAGMPAIESRLQQRHDLLWAKSLWLISTRSGHYGACSPTGLRPARSQGPSHGRDRGGLQPSGTARCCSEIAASHVSSKTVQIRKGHRPCPVCSTG